MVWQASPSLFTVGPVGRGTNGLGESSIPQEMENLPANPGSYVWTPVDISITQGLWKQLRASLTPWNHRDLKEPFVGGVGRVQSCAGAFSLTPHCSGAHR